MSKEQKKVIIYRSTVYALSGVETWVCNLCQHLCDFYDITLLYENGDYRQISEISKYVNVEKRDFSKKYECDVLIANYADKEVDEIVAKKTIATVHSNYLDSNPPREFCFGFYADLNVCVSDDCEKAFKEYIERKSIVIPNMLAKKAKTKKILHLVSFTRLTKEKGYKRIKQLAELLKKNGIKFDWKIFTDNKAMIDNLRFNEVIYMPVTHDKYDYIVDADYLVQLSDSEAFCYSVHESLQYGTPVIVTDLEVFKDVVIDGYNGYKLPLDMKDVDIQTIVTKIPRKFKYENKSAEITEKWFEILGESVKERRKHKDFLVQLEVIYPYNDKLLNRNMAVGERFYANKVRANELTSADNSIKRQVCRVM